MYFYPPEYTDLNYDVILHGNEVQKILKNISEEIDEEYYNQEFTILAIMDGAFYFASRLTNLLKNEKYVLTFCKTSCYNNNIRKELRLVYPPQRQFIHKKKVLIIDDIYDTGETLGFVKNYILEMGAADIKTSVLFNKEGVEKKCDLPNIVGAKVPNKFLWGAGLDSDGYYRNINEVRAQKEY